MRFLPPIPFSKKVVGVTARKDLVSQVAFTVAPSSTLSSYRFVPVCLETGRAFLINFRSRSRARSLSLARARPLYRARAPSLALSFARALSLAHARALARQGAVLPDRALYLPTLSHLLVVIKPLSLSPQMLGHECPAAVSP